MAKICAVNVKEKEHDTAYHLSLIHIFKKENEKTADGEQGTDDITEEQAEADVVKLFRCV